MIYTEALKNNIFNLISSCAGELGLECYVIGGFVRDYIISAVSYTHLRAHET